ncbi:MAG: hypothetical protein ACLUD0_00125 [Eubacterium ramulus]
MKEFIQKALEKIIRYGVDRMIYISCKPTSLQQGSGDFAGTGICGGADLLCGYVSGSVHVETVVGLQRKDT